MRRLFIVRHGNTFGPGEAPRRVGSRTDIPLVASGEQQAAALGTWFAERDIRFDAALSGPLLRTRQTASAILARAGNAAPTLRLADWLGEIDHGPDENQLEEVVIARIGAEAIAAWDTRAEAPPGWIVDRAPRIAAWSAMLDDRSEGNVLLVTSNGAARFALLARPDLAAQLPPDGHGMKLRTGAYGEIDCGDDGVLTLAAWDVRPGELSSA